MTDTFVGTLESVMAVEYSVIISNFSTEDSPFHHRHCPPHAATVQRVQGTTCLAILAARDAAAFMAVAREACAANPLTMITLVAPADLGDPPPRTEGWSAVRIVPKGYPAWAHQGSTLVE